MRLSICLLLAACLHAQPTPEAQVRELMGNFLAAFTNLDWPAFRKCWVDNPVVFFPSLVEPTGKRTENTTAFEADWHRQFDLIRESAARRGVTKAPFQRLEPHDLRIDFPAPSVAVVTFHLGPGRNGLGRRMFVVAKTDAGWKITHLHASNLNLTPGN
jgi:hypothetical protein